MKTYLFDTLNRFRRFSENLDVKATLCNKPWQVFNDSGEKELYIFQEDGTLLITYSGRVTHSTWQYIAANKSIVISAGQQSYMVHPAFMDKVLFALQVDGTNECAFLIDENNAQNFAPRSYTALMGYFEEKERKALEEERRKQLATIEAKCQRELELEEHRRQEEKRQKEWCNRMHIYRVYSDNIESNVLGELHYSGLFLLGALAFVPVLVFIGRWTETLADDTWGPYIVLGCSVCMCWPLLPILWWHIIRRKRLIRYVKGHLNDWETPHIVQEYNENTTFFPWFKVNLRDLLGNSNSLNAE